jgi:hypothetical protein
MFPFCLGVADMLSDEASDDAKRRGGPRLEPWIARSVDPDVSSGRRLSALSQTPLASRFFSWRGQSGKSYVFSIYAPSACPAFCDAVLIVAARDERGVRRVVTAFETGVFPEPVLTRAQRSFAVRGDDLEFHVHLLARSAAERRQAIADLLAVAGPLACVKART